MSDPLPPPPPSKGRFPAPPPVRALARDAFGRELPDPAESGVSANGTAEPSAPKKREAATDTLGRRAGALSDELDFPAFVASLVHGTFDAIVDSSIRQMESFADLVAAVAKPLDQFTRENVTENQARDFLVERHPRAVTLVSDGTVPRLVPAVADEDAESPEWLAEYGLAGQPLTTELLETAVLPRAREEVARQRLQTLSTLVLLGMNRVVVKDGTINARLRFRAAAADKTAFDYATGSDPSGGGAEWGTRGARTYAAPTTKVSTVGVNVQADTELKAELFGEVRINFASETLPLDRLLDEARRAQVERHARTAPAPRALPPAGGGTP